MEVLVSKQVELLPIDLLLVQHVLVVHFLEQAGVLDAIGLEELQVGHLERLPDGLGYQVGLEGEGGGRLVKSLIG